MNIRVKNEAELAAWGKKFSSFLKAGDFIALKGTLGAGKTSLSRAIIRALTDQADLDVPSPTYTLLQEYNAPNLVISHFDLYRLEDPEETHELGWEEAIHDTLCLVEWPENAGNHLPENRLEITLTIPEGNKESRELHLSPYGLWRTRELD